MRGGDDQQVQLWSYVSLEKKVPKDHPLRPIQEMVNDALSEMSGAFSGLYSRTGRPSIPPERLLRALLLQVLYTVRSERMLMEQIDYNLLFRWFVGLGVDDAVWNHSTFSRNRERLLEGDVARLFFATVLERAHEAGLLSQEHFTVDGTLIEAWAGHKSFKPKDDQTGPPAGTSRNRAVDYRGKKRSNKTHESTTDPQARLYRKSWGTEAKLCFAGHAVIDNRHGLVVNARLTEATGRAEYEAALAMAAELPGRRRVTLGADKGYDTKEVVKGLRALNVTPHVAAKDSSSAIDGRTTSLPGYAISQRRRKRVEEVFGWMKTVGTLRKTRHRGKRRVGWMFTFALAAYNLVRIRNLTAEGV